ncbi:MAG: outer membrane protein assembly factor BamD [Proteobacteria bacterium]|nr:outer membrane protein assembly factor BamD [Pseudomonadota bacterium]
MKSGASKNKIALALLPLLLAACGTAKEEGDLTGTVSSLYNDGLTQVQGKKYAKAVHTFDELERQYPYSGWATRGQILSAYAQMQNGDYEESIVTIDRFIKMHPGHPNLDYMYYLKGLNHFERLKDVARDQGQTHDALDAFQEVVNRFPDSIYARDSRLKITLCIDHLAGKEMVVGRYYEGQKQYLSAINRFRAVVKDYQTSTQTPEALYRMTESYLALGVTDEATRAAAILGYNYPGSDWYKKAYHLLTQAHLAPAGQEQSWAKKLAKGFKDLF